MGMREFVIPAPERIPYDKLRTALLQRTSASELRRLQQLLTSEELGDGTLSQLLSHLQQLIGNGLATFDVSMLSELFRQRLPHSVPMILASTSNLRLRKS